LTGQQVKNTSMEYSLFSSLVFHHQIENFNKEQLVDYAYSERTKYPRGAANSNVSGWQSEGFYHLTDNPVVETVGAALSKCHFFKERVILKLKSLWINVNGKGAFNMEHNHPDCDLAAVIWVQAPENSGKLVFKNPHGFTHHKMSMYTDEVQARNYQYTAYNFRPTEGSMLLFPSYLNHAVLFNESDYDRISISFNMVMEYK